MTAPSLGHYAPLSFVVIGKRQRSEVGSQTTDDRRQMTEVRGQRTARRHGDAEISNFGLRISDLGYEMWDVGRHRA
jgi:hypothetical protein